MKIICLLILSKKSVPIAIGTVAKKNTPHSAGCNLI
jgi:hypothetical protein